VGKQKGWCISKIAGVLAVNPPLGLVIFYYLPSLLIPNTKLFSLAICVGVVKIS
jgi:integral membrane sensor domain MASE1